MVETDLNICKVTPFLRWTGSKKGFEPLTLHHKIHTKKKQAFYSLFFLILL